MSKKRCPVLVKLGVFPPRLTSYVDDVWLKYCIGKCPLEICVYEYGGKIREEDRKLLEEVEWTN